MRWAIVAVLFIVAAFGFFIGYAVSSYLISNVKDALDPYADELSDTTYKNELTLISSAFGIICAIGFTLMIAVFVMDSLSDEPETYWRE